MIKQWAQRAHYCGGGGRLQLISLLSNTRHLNPGKMWDFKLQNAAILAFSST